MMLKGNFEASEVSSDDVYVPAGTATAHKSSTLPESRCLVVRILTQVYWGMRNSRVNEPNLAFSWIGSASISEISGCSGAVGMTTVVTPACAAEANCNVACRVYNALACNSR